MIIRKKSDANYTKIPNTPDDYLNDPTITAKSKGILTQLLCKPDTWTLSVTYLVKTNKEGHSAIRTAVNELIGSGYIHREITRDKSGRIRGTQHIIFDHRVSPAEATHTTAGVEYSKVSSGMEQPTTQNEAPEPDTTSHIKTQIRETAPNATDRMRKIHIRKTAPVLKNKGINKIKGLTTTPDQPEQEPVIESPPEPSQSYPATEDINSLLNLIPEQHQQPMVKALVNRAVKEYSPMEVEEAILYASANVKGGAMQYKAYLDKTLKNQWAAGYLETMKNQTTTPALFSPEGFTGAVPAGRYPNGTVTGSGRMDGNYMAAAQFLTDMGVEV